MITKEQIERLCELEKAATPGPWDFARRVTGNREPDHFAIVEDNGGRSILDTLNSEAAEIHDSDEGHRGWDETGRKDSELVAELRNAAKPLLSAARKLLEIREVALEQGLSSMEIGEAVIKIIGE